MIVRISWDANGETDYESCLKDDERFIVLGSDVIRDVTIDKEIVMHKRLMYEVIKEHCSEFKKVDKYQIYEMTEEEFALLLLQI